MVTVDGYASTPPRPENVAVGPPSPPYWNDCDAELVGPDPEMADHSLS